MENKKVTWIKAAAVRAIKTVAPFFDAYGPDSFDCVTDVVDLLY